MRARKRGCFATVAALLLMLLSPQAVLAAGIDTDYRGADAGTLVFSTSTLKIAMNFTFYYKDAKDVRAPDETGGAGKIDCPCVGFWHPTMSDPDYHDDYETGKVQIQHLKPGNYEVYTFQFFGTIIVAGLTWNPDKAMAIPFTIKPGETTYIGNFARAPSLGTPLASQLGAAGYFVVSDRHARDLAIARKKQPDLPPATVMVTDVSQFGWPFLLAGDPYAPKS